jgi:methyl-accepting chemotaxis protein
MSLRDVEGAAVNLADRVRRERIEAVLASVLGTSVHLAFLAGIVRASIVFVVATVIALAGWRWLGSRARGSLDVAMLPRRSGWSVFFGSFASLVLAPLSIAIVDPGAALDGEQWRSTVLAAAACSGFAGVFVFHRLRMACARSPAGHDRAHPVVTLESAGDWTAARAREIRIVIAAVALALSGVLVDGVLEARASGWGAVRITAAGLCFAAVFVWLGRVLARAVSHELEWAVGGIRAERASAEARSGEGEAAAIAALAASVATGDELTRSLEVERDQRSIEQAHAERVARELADRAMPVQQNALELVGRIEASRRIATLALAAGEALEARTRGLEDEIESSARWLDGIEQGQRGLTESLARLSTASRETSAGLAALAKANRGVDSAADSITAFSRDVLARAEIGRAKFGETVAGMEAIRTATRAAESVIRGLAARTQEIGGILDVIDDVGDQTSLLALNAAIIAAQAGEQGRAFSVVADEIRDLADRVLVSTKEIGGLIRAVQSESDHAIGAIEAGSSSVERGVELSVEAGRTLDEITEVTRETGTRIEGILDSVRAQASTLERVLGLVVRVESGVGELATAVDHRAGDRERAARAAQALREAMEEMRSAVREQSAQLSRIEFDLGNAHASARVVGSTLEEQSTSCRELARVVEQGADRLRSLRRIGDELTLAHRTLRLQTDSLRLASHRPSSSITRSGLDARAIGERS